MTCVHLRPNASFSAQSGAGAFFGINDECELLLPTEERHEEYLEALHAKGHDMAPVPFACPVASTERWTDCPLFKIA
jgi:hypothetical protein